LLPHCNLAILIIAIVIIVDAAAVSLSIQISLQDLWPEADFLNHMVIVCKICLGSAALFPAVAVLFYFPTNTGNKHSSGSTSFPTPIFWLLLFLMGVVRGGIAWL
jgi:hypothetical protein